MASTLPLASNEAHEDIGLVTTMWDWINCHLAGRHEYAVWSDSNRMYLRCLRCGRRSNGWNVAAEEASAHHVHESQSDDRHHARHHLIAGALSLLGLSLLGR